MNDEQRAARADVWVVVVEPAANYPQGTRPIAVRAFSSQSAALAYLAEWRGRPQLAQVYERAIEEKP